MSSPVFVSVAALEYRDIAPPLVAKAKSLPEEPPSPGISEEEAQRRIENALRAAEQRWSAAAEEHESARKAQLTTALESFARQRARYFHQVESEVVQLTLAIAAKILQREAALDPTLLGALVRIGLDRMNAGSSVRVRLPPDQLRHWEGKSTTADSGSQYELIPDDALKAGDCVVETDLGEANFGMEAQLKEVEQGLLDVLSRRPAVY